MADRSFHQGPKALERETVLLTATVGIGGSGAPTIATGTGKGITSIVHDSAGLYTVTLQDKYARLEDFSARVLHATNVDLDEQLRVVSMSAGTVQFCMRAAAVATDPPNGSSLLLRILLKNAND